MYPVVYEKSHGQEISNANRHCYFHYLEVQLVKEGALGVWREKKDCSECRCSKL